MGLKKANPKYRSLSIKMADDEYQDFKRFCHMDFTQMSPVAYKAVKKCIEDLRKKHSKTAIPNFVEKS